MTRSVKLSIVSTDFVPSFIFITDYMYACWYENGDLIKVLCSKGLSKILKKEILYIVKRKEL